MFDNVVCGLFGLFITTIPPEGSSPGFSKVHTPRPTVGVVAFNWVLFWQANGWSGPASIGPGASKTSTLTISALSVQNPEAKFNSNI